MRPIFATEEENEFLEAWARLADNGIPVFEPSKYSDLPGFRVGPRDRVLCIWLDNQYEDAISLLRDPSHEVKNPVDVEEFARLQDQADEQMEESANTLTERILNWIVGSVGVGIVGAIAYVALRS